MQSELNVDVLEIISEYVSWRDMSSLCRTNKYNSVLFENLLTRFSKFGKTYLYKRQVESIKQILDGLKGNESTCKFLAPVSYGKTLIGLSVAYKYVPFGNVIIAVPSSVIPNWKEQIKRYLPDSTRRLIASREIVICDSISSAGMEFYKKNKHMTSKIYVVSYRTAEYMVELRQDVSLFVFDEAHMNRKAQKYILKLYYEEPGNSDAKVLLLSATNRKTTSATDVKIDDDPDYTKNDEESFSCKSDATYILPEFNVRTVLGLVTPEVLKVELNTSHNHIILLTCKPVTISTNTYGGKLYQKNRPVRL